MLNGRQAWWRIFIMKWEEILYFNRRKILLKKKIVTGIPKDNFDCRRKQIVFELPFPLHLKHWLPFHRDWFSPTLLGWWSAWHTASHLLSDHLALWTKNHRSQISLVFQINFKLRTNIYEIQDQLMDFHHVASFSMTDTTFRCNNLQQQPLQKFCRCGGSTLWYIRTLAWKRCFTL